MVHLNFDCFLFWVPLVLKIQFMFYHFQNCIFWLTRLIIFCHSFVVSTSWHNFKNGCLLFFCLRLTQLGSYFKDDLFTYCQCVFNWQTMEVDDLVCIIFIVDLIKYFPSNVPMDIFLCLLKLIPCKSAILRSRYAVDTFYLSRILLFQLLIHLLEQNRIFLFDLRIRKFLIFINFCLRLFERHLFFTSSAKCLFVFSEV